MQRTHWSYQSLEKIGKPEEDSSKANAKKDKNYKCERNALRRKMTETTDKPKVMSERALKTRAKIMDATRAFIVREGVGRLSIDKIVKESGTSKGAFLYHFKNRKALFCALVEEYVDHLNERMNAHMGKYQNSEEPLILGYASWYEDFDKDDGGYAVLGVALLALLLHEPDALKPFHDWYAKVFKMVQDSPIKTPQLLTAIMAFEGFFFTHKMGFDSLDKETKEATWRYIIEQVAPQPKKKASKSPDKKLPA